MMEDVNFVGAYAGGQRMQQRNDPFSNTYNPRWQNHPNFSWREQGSKPLGSLEFRNQTPKSQYPSQAVQERNRVWRI